MRMGRLAAARSMLDSALSEHRDDFQLHWSMAHLCTRMGDGQTALTHATRCVELNPSIAQHHVVLGHCRLKLEQLDESCLCFTRAVEIDPSLTEAHTSLGIIASMKREYDAAESHWRESIRRNPMGTAAVCNLATVIRTIGRGDEAVRMLEPVVERNPFDINVQRAMALASLYAIDISPKQVTDYHRRFGSAVLRAVGPVMDRFENDRDQHRRLRIGYLSPDFRDHSVASFALPLIEHHDRDVYEVNLFSVARSPDAITRRFIEAADHWHDLSSCSDMQIADVVRGKRIDVLIDLAGLFDGHRQGVMARRPAPVQATYLGYPNTTGLRAVDWRIVDHVTDPDGAESLAVENLARIDGCFLCYRVRHDMPQPAPKDEAELTRPITFGSFNNISKLNRSVLDAWARILANVLNSRMLFKATPLSSDSVRRWLSNELIARGVGSDRIEMIGHTETQSEHLAMYDRVDIALDTFPYNGTTTTCEAMWMGVPLVTVRGDCHAARVGASIMRATDNSELTAESVDQYVEKAVDLANDPGRLIEYRSILRERMARSELCDVGGFARRFERLIRDMWRTWCRQA